jgi:MFS family permease
MGEWAATGLLDDGHGRAVAGRRFVRPDRRLTLLSALGFAALLCEGAASDWSAVYLRVVLAASAGVAGLGYVAFSVAMILGRLTGDRLTTAIGPRRLFRSSCVVATVGFGIGLLVGTTVSVVAGFGFLGLGLACGAPLVFSEAGRHGDPGPSVATVTTGSYLGFLAGPPIIGAIADIVGLHWALACVPLVSLSSVFLAGASAFGPSPATEAPPGRPA